MLFKKNSSNSRVVLNAKGIVSVVLLFVLASAVVFSSITAAWLAMNTSLDSNDIKMQIEVSPNLVISDKYTGDLATATAAGTRTPAANDTNSSTSFTQVVFTRSQTILIPATHASSSATGLKYNTTPDRVSRTTGYKSGSDDLVLADVPASPTGGRTYFVDYEVYIASTDVAMTVTSLRASVSGATLANDYQYAASIDFYNGSVSSSNYMGTLNLANKGMNSSGSTSGGNLVAGTPQSLDLPITSIPLNTSGSVHIIMRCYFDGALEKTNNQAYVYSQGLTTADFITNVSFTGIDADATRS